MERQTLRIAGLLILLFCTFQLGRIDKDTEYKKALVKCVKGPEHADLKTFYGHGFKKEGLVHTIFNHAIAHNANIYFNCIMKEVGR